MNYQELVPIVMNYKELVPLINEKVGLISDYGGAFTAITAILIYLSSILRKKIYIASSLYR